MTLRLTSSAFVANGAIPKKHTCDGRNTSPPLEWSGAPAGTASFALIVDDPDAPDPRAPKRTWVHWVLYDISPTERGIAEGRTPPGAREGKNDWGRTGWGGPCPPIGRHRYVHKLYALDVQLGDLHQPTKAEVERAMQGHVVAEARMVGTYEKSQKG